MHPKYKLLVVDVDGTILNRDNKISVEDVAAIKLASKAGVKVALCTGRVPQGCRLVLKELGLDGYHIFFDGALVCNPETGDEVYAVPISPELVRETTVYARKNQLHYDIYSSTRFYSQGDDWATEIRKNFFYLDPVLADFDALSRTERIIKGTVVTRTEAERQRARLLQQHFKGRLDFSWTTTPAFPEVHFINVINPEVNKGKALAELCRFFKISRSEAMAIGDGLNDVALLNVAGFAVAMGNSADELRAVAHIVTRDVEHSGVAEAITKFLLP
jgi:5-amino-6-(5-phospho-D-ribitylamino)uracil phosphatase